MTLEIALSVVVVALVVLVGSLVTLLMQLRRPVAEAGDILAHMNTELPVLLKEIRVITEKLNVLVEHARDGVEHATVLLHAAGTLGDSVQRLQQSIGGGRRSLFTNLSSAVAGFRALTNVIKTHLHSAEGTYNGK
jgi:uncharacterized protein YoxC